MPRITKVETIGKSPQHSVACLVTPFAGKLHCFKKYLAGVKHLPHQHMEAIWYDNSNDPDFHQKLIQVGKQLFPLLTVLTDESPHYTVESNAEYAHIDYRAFAIYDTLTSYLPSIPLTMILEDDVELPPGGFERLKAVLTSDTRIGTVVGNVCNRRMRGCSHLAPIVWNFILHETFPKNGHWAESKQMECSKPYGIELIGAAHTGCWLTRTALIKQLGFKFQEDGIFATDRVWGYRLNKAGHWMAIEWSVQCKHHWKLDGKRGYVDHALVSQLPMVMDFKGPYLHTDGAW